MPVGGPNEGFASNYGYGGMPGTTTGIAAGGYAATGNPQVGAQGNYQAAAQQSVANRYPNSYWGKVLAAPKKAATTTTAKKKTATTPVVVPSRFPSVADLGAIPPTSNFDQPFQPAVNPPNYPDWVGQPELDWGGTPPNYSTGGNSGWGMKGYGLSDTSGSGTGMSMGPHYGGLAAGGFAAPGSLNMVGEQGPELMQAGPGGASVMSNPQTMQTLGGMSPDIMRAQFDLMRQFGGGLGGQGGRTGLSSSSMQPPGPGQAQPPRLQDYVRQLTGGGPMNTSLPAPNPGGPGQGGGGGGGWGRSPAMMDWRAARPEHTQGMARPAWQSAMRTWHDARPQRPDNWGMGGNALGMRGLLSRFGA